MTQSFEDHLEALTQRGWTKFPHDPGLLRWIEATSPTVRAAISAQENAQWWRYNRTWFAGVNALPNDALGAVSDGLPVQGQAFDFVREALGFAREWDQAQISAVYPGYPQPMLGQEGPPESDAVFRYRRDRDAAHLDGFRRVGAERRRFIQEPHAFILGIPITDHPVEASPFTIWEGSHRLVQHALQGFYGNTAPEQWPDMDVTETYQPIRSTCFETCNRVPIHARVGEAYLVHRHALHGVAPWPEECDAKERVILYFRPPFSTLDDWLHGEI